MKIAIFLLAISIVISWISGLRLSDSISKVNDNTKHQQELINKMTWAIIKQSDEIRALKKELYVHEIDLAYWIIDNAWYEMTEWDFETKYQNDIVFSNTHRTYEKYVCVDTENKIIVSNCTYFQYPEYK